MNNTNYKAHHAAKAIAVPITLSRDVERVLLIHPPVYDIRIPWAQYIQPIRLLRLATFFRRLGIDVQMIDVMDRSSDARLRRMAVRKLDIEGRELNIWRFGISSVAVDRALHKLQHQQWVPNVIYVECLTTFWWEGAQEVIRAAKAVFPTSRVVLIGAYAEQAAEHARLHTQADDVGVLDWSRLERLAPDLAHYATKPASIYLSLAGGTRPAAEVVDEIVELGARYNTRSFAFLEHAITTDHRDAYCGVLEAIIARGIRVRLSALGTVPLRDFADYPDLAELMKQAGYAYICFADDRDTVPGLDTDEMLIEYAARATEACDRAGFPKRTDAIIGSLCLGRSGEILESRAWTATYLAHHLGSIIFWPYQPSPDELPDTPLEQQNGKLFPLRSRNGLSFTDYLSVLGLSSVLNAKYRTQTFDFMGDSLIARLFQNSLERRAWEPPEEIKGTLKLPVEPR